MRYRFEWDPKKNAANVRKHGIAFEDAARAFADPLADTDMEGNDHGEVRWKAVGDVDGFLIRVTYTIREEISEDGETEIVRIISARKATRGEARAHRGHTGNDR